MPEHSPIYLHALGHFHPENLISNAFLEGLEIGATEDWILNRTGIRTRHTMLPLDYLTATRNRDPRAAEEASIYTNAETSCLASKMALRRAGLNASDLGMVIAGSSAPRFGSPAEACIVADRLGIAVPAFDINSACTSWAVQLHFLAMMQPLLVPDFVLLICAENLTRVVDYSDRTNAILMGDCTVASIVSTKVPSRVEIRRTAIQSDPSGWGKVQIPYAGHMHQAGGPVQNFAIRKMVATIEDLRPYARADFKFVGHQANLPMLQSVCTRAAIDPANHIHTLQVRGHCGAAGVPSVISENFETFQKGQQILAATVGAGLTWAGVLLEVAGGDSL